MKYFAPLGIAACLALTGCAPSTALGVRQLGPDRMTGFTVEENYQPVYRKVLNQARQCYQAGMITAEMRAEGELYHDIKEGTVTVAVHGGLGVDTHLVVDIKGIEDKKSQVIVHTAIWPVEKTGNLIKEWVLDNSTECTPKKA